AAASLHAHRERPIDPSRALSDNARPPLPVAASSFVGREPELAELHRLLRPPTRRRLVTLTGAGGCGKSRLALRVATDLIPAFADAARLVEPAPLDDSRLVPRTVATTFGLLDTPNEPIDATLLRFLGSRELLLLLDNCEHLVDACATLASAILHS